MCYERALEDSHIAEKLTFDANLKKRAIINVDITREINTAEFGKLLSKKI
jgi:hypothetical protein